ncbi:MAG TPA: GvpL/GvpF family gas vesicle protein [Thermoanaerobaculia bacterium]|nr:GvpL/GvpF family gas vesicle protein [Thermoanaerobaculia bacterium]
MAADPQRPADLALPAAGGATATYVYGVVASPMAPDLSAPQFSAMGLAGLPGASAPRSLALGGEIRLVVADVPLSSYGSEALEAGMADLAWVSDCAVAHESMVELLARTGTVVPMKLFTLFSSDQRALVELGAQAAYLARVLERIAGCAEWGLRILWHEARARAAAPPAAGDGGGRASGRGFLLRKKQEQEGARELARAARHESERLYEELAGLAREARRRPPPTAEAGARLLLDAAFLVPVDRTSGFDGVVRRGADRLAAGACEVTLSGPWPAYNFIAEEPPA